MGSVSRKYYWLLSIFVIQYYALNVSGLHCYVCVTPDEKVKGACESESVRPCNSLTDVRISATMNKKTAVGLELRAQSINSAKKIRLCKFQCYETIVRGIRNDKTIVNLICQSTTSPIYTRGCTNQDLTNLKALNDKADAAARRSGKYKTITRVCSEDKGERLACNAGHDNARLNLALMAIIVISTLGLYWTHSWYLQFQTLVNNHQQ